MRFTPLFNVSASFLDKLADLSCTVLMAVQHVEELGVAKSSI